MFKLNPGDFVKYSDLEFNDRLGVYGIVIRRAEPENTIPAIIEVMWGTSDFESVYEDELQVISESK